jgi:hypothetical protein
MDESTRGTKRRTTRRTQSFAAEAAFRARLAELGAELLEPAWLGSAARHHVICANGHDCWPTPNKVQQGRGVCQECGKAATQEKVNLARMADAERRFRALLDELGVVLLDPYQGVGVRLRALCPAGHEFQVWPATNRPVVCKTCGRKDQVAAKAKFREGLDRLGAVLMEPHWLGAHQRHQVRCAAGHDYQVWPSDVMNGGGTCQQCTGRDPRVAEAAFRARLAELGATPLYERWLGVNKGHHIRCANGHESWPRPANVRKGGGLCKKCTALARIARNRARTETAFLARLAELGATPLYEKWLGTRRKHHVLCVNGHDAYPTVNNVLNGGGVCSTCAGNNPVVAEANFRARLAELGAVPLYEKWLGNNQPHLVRCAAGHECSPYPAGVQQGEGVCRKCRGKLWDAFYVVEHEELHRVKFGVTSGDARPRLADHHKDGYRTVVRLLTGLPDGAAPDAERAVKAALAMAGEKPVRGTEYFDVSCLALILDVADSWLARVADTEEYVIESNGQLALFAA